MCLIKLLFIIIRLYLLTNIITMFMIPMQQALYPLQPKNTNAHLTNHCYKNNNAVICYTFTVHVILE